MLTALMAKSRNILSVELIPSADAVLNKTVKRSGFSKKDVVARMCAWFASQDLEVQKLVLGEIPASMADQARDMALRRLVGNAELEKAKEAEKPRDRNGLAGGGEPLPQIKGYVTKGGKTTRVE